MPDVPMAIDPTPVADTALADRIRRLEEQLAAREATALAGEEEIARRVVTLLAERASQHRVGSNGPPVPGLITTALTAARAANAFFPAGPSAPPGVAPRPTETGFRAWLLTQVVGEFRLIVQMYFDPHYRLSRVAQFGVPLIVGLYALSYFVFNYTCAIPIAAQFGERAVGFVLAVTLYKVLAREAVRYKQVLDYLAQYGYG